MATAELHYRDPHYWAPAFAGEAQRVGMVRRVTCNRYRRRTRTRLRYRGAATVSG